MPKRFCDWCHTDTVYLAVNHVGRLCRMCYEVWWEEEVLPDLRRSQDEFIELRERNRMGQLQAFDQSVAHLPKGEGRRIVDVQLPDWPADEHSTTTRPKSDLRHTPTQTGSVHQPAKQEC